MASIPAELTAILLNDLDRSVAPSNIPGKYKLLEDSCLKVPRSGSVMASVRLRSQVMERSDESRLQTPEQGQCCVLNADMRGDSKIGC